jgi:hypothetical protein
VGYYFRNWNKKLLESDIRNEIKSNYENDKYFGETIAQREKVVKDYNDKCEKKLLLYDANRKEESMENFMKENRYTIICEIWWKSELEIKKLDRFA